MLSCYFLVIFDFRMYYFDSPVCCVWFFLEVIPSSSQSHSVLCAQGTISLQALNWNLFCSKHVLLRVDLALQLRSEGFFACLFCFILFVCLGPYPVILLLALCSILVVLSLVSGIKFWYATCKIRNSLPTPSPNYPSNPDLFLTVEENCALRIYQHF